MSDFSIGGKKWPGISKLIEEMGEVAQVCGKLIGSRGEENHWDGTNLRRRLEDELADLTAAIRFVQQSNGLNANAIADRARVKLILFDGWHDSEQRREGK